MPIIEIDTIITSDLVTCFDLSRSIDLHKISTAKTKEIAIAGTTNGLINLHEYVTWQAVHFGVKQELTTKITLFNRPFHFRDEQVKGAFSYFIHDHHFEAKDKYVLMRDIFKYKSPFGVIGKLVDKLILESYMTNLLIERNKVIKQFAETNQGQILLKG